MSEAALTITVDDPILDTDFAKQMVRQMRAIDSYGTYDDWSTAKILAPFVMTKEQRREVPIVGDPDEILMARIKGFYNAISTMIESECGLMAVPMVHLSHEGFGRAIITVGKLVVMDKVLRDVHRFSFLTLAKMKEEADKLVSTALDIIDKHPEVARL